ncbi:MAG: hypothetical protein KBA13_01805 [Chitinophagales bacterium]|nr:hypothetical protein [Chitinophagales bacterium]
MKKLSLLFGLAVLLFSGCKKENPISSTSELVSVPKVVSFLDDSYLAILGTDDVAPQVMPVDGFYGYAVDSIYGFNVGGQIVDTIWFSDVSWNGDTTTTGIAKVELIATNSKGISGIASSKFVIVLPPTDPYPNDISGNYIRGGLVVTTVEKIVDGVYVLYNPIFSTNLAWLDTYCIVIHSVADGIDFVDQVEPGFPGFGTFTYANEFYDENTLTICADMTRIEDGLALSRCVTRE